ncbi:MAG: O-methyltransferase [Saprospiraceae bacterium]|nr:O-methyltransferase [Saprospiraceae bacterium]
MITPIIEQYIEAHTSFESQVLADLNRATHLKVMQPNMLSGHYQGILLQLISSALRPKTILEIGTYTGYSAICLAAGLQPGGTLHTIDVNEELLPFAKPYFEAAGIQHQIQQHLGDAKTIIPTIEGPLDLVFIDADKAAYSHYFDLVVDKLRPGGVILADNVLWKGKVVNDHKDNKTKALDDFNKKVQADERVKNLLLPIRDGLMWIERL